MRIFGGKQAVFSGKRSVSMAPDLRDRKCVWVCVWTGDVERERDISLVKCSAPISLV